MLRRDSINIKFENKQTCNALSSMSGQPLCQGEGQTWGGSLRQACSTPDMEGG